MTCLRVTVKEIEKVGDEKAWKDNKALGLIVKDKGVQAIYGESRCVKIRYSRYLRYLGD